MLAELYESVIAVRPAARVEGLAWSSGYATWHATKSSKPAYTEREARALILDHWLGLALAEDAVALVHMSDRDEPPYAIHDDRIMRFEMEGQTITRCRDDYYHGNSPIEALAAFLLAEGEAPDAREGKR